MKTNRPTNNHPLGVPPVVSLLPSDRLGVPPTTPDVDSKVAAATVERALAAAAEAAGRMIKTVENRVDPDTVDEHALADDVCSLVSALLSSGDDRLIDIAEAIQIVSAY